MTTKGERLQAVYDKIPKIECKKKCSAACGPIALTKLELKRLGPKPTFLPLVALGRFIEWTCPYLDVNEKLCSVYAKRPLICRLFGVADGLLCQWGCKPERVLSRAEVGVLFREVREIGGKSVDLDGVDFGSINPERKP